MNEPSSSKSYPKYRRIADELLREIRTTMKSGTKLPSEPELAKRFEVHILTIREALRVMQKWGVIQRQRGVGTHVINPLAGRWVTILSEMNVFSPASDSLFVRSVIHYLREFLDKEGLFARISIGRSVPSSESGHMTSQDFVADLESNHLAGVFAISTSPSAWWLERLEKQGVPVVGSNRLFPYHAVFDPWSDMAESVRYLVDHGRDCIAYIGWQEHFENESQNSHLAKALDEIERCFSVTIHREWIKSEIHPIKAGAGWEEFRELWFSYQEKPDGLIIDNEHMVPDVKRAMSELGVRVPEDVMVVSHRTRGSQSECGFSSAFIEVDPRLYAFRMFETFMRLYRGETDVGTTVCVPRFLVNAKLPEAGEETRSSSRHLIPTP